jgi:hypothetical protein
MSEDLAKQRFFILQAVRISGVLLALLGLLVVAGKIDLLPGWAGIILVALGMIEMLIVPKLLASRWKSPPQ